MTLAKVQKNIIFVPHFLMCVERRTAAFIVLLGWRLLTLRFNGPRRPHGAPPPIVIQFYTWTPIKPVVSLLYGYFSEQFYFMSVIIIIYNASCNDSYNPLYCYYINIMVYNMQSTDLINNLLIEYEKREYVIRNYTFSMIYAEERCLYIMILNTI